VRFLTGDTQLHSGHCAAARFRDLRAALRTVGCAGTLGDTALCAIDPIAHRGISLFLNRTFRRPACRHLDHHPSESLLPRNMVPDGGVYKSIERRCSIEEGGWWSWVWHPTGWRLRFQGV